jgi:hypothetical protein
MFDRPESGTDRGSRRYEFVINHSRGGRRLMIRVLWSFGRPVCAACAASCNRHVAQAAHRRPPRAQRRCSYAKIRWPMDRRSTARARSFAAGRKASAIGHSRGERTTKIHAPTDKDCRLSAFFLTGGQIADCAAAARRARAATTATPSVTRLRIKASNPIELMFRQLKGYRGIATRYDRLATNFLSWA